MNKIPLIVISGPTGVGKTEISIELAEKLDAEIIISDSRQIYKYFDIGTAKPTKKQQSLIQHHLIDIAEPNYTYTVAEFKKDAEEAITKIINKNKLPMLVGGTGLYIKTLIDNYNLPPHNLEIRKNIKETILKKGNEFLYQELKKVDNIAASKIHPNDIFRLIRALEVYYITGKPISSFWNNNQITNYNLIYIFINTTKDILVQRIKTRIENMLKDGLIDEVSYIVNKYSYELPLLYTLNYREICMYLQGKVSLENAKELMVQNTKKYVKQQLTWFKADKRVIWFNIQDYKNIKEIIKDIYEFIKAKLIWSMLHN